MCSKCDGVTDMNDGYLVETFSPYNTSLRLRDTHTYVGTYRDEDRWTTLGEMKVLQKQSMLMDDSDPCEPTRTIHLILAKPGVRNGEVDHSLPLADDDTIVRAIKDTFTHAGCAHDYDCCGCWSTYVHEVLRLKDTSEHRYVVITWSGRNY